MNSLVPEKRIVAQNMNIFQTYKNKVLVMINNNNYLKFRLFKWKFTTDCEIIHGLYILSVSQVKPLLFKMDGIV